MEDDRVIIVTFKNEKMTTPEEIDRCLRVLKNEIIKRAYDNVSKEDREKHPDLKIDVHLTAYRNIEDGDFVVEIVIDDSPIVVRTIWFIDDIELEEEGFKDYDMEDEGFQIPKYRRMKKQYDDFVIYGKKPKYISGYEEVGNEQSEYNRMRNELLQVYEPPKQKPEIAKEKPLMWGRLQVTP